MSNFIPIPKGPPIFASGWDNPNGSRAADLEPCARQKEGRPPLPRKHPKALRKPTSPLRWPKPNSPSPDRDARPSRSWGAEATRRSHPSGTNGSDRILAAFRDQQEFTVNSVLRIYERDPVHNGLASRLECILEFPLRRRWVWRRSRLRKLRAKETSTDRMYHPAVRFL